jgi:glutamate-1-semialdehyde 2,1-aminomutase
MEEALPLSAMSALAALSLGVAWGLPRLKRRVELSRAKHRSLAGHSRMAKRVAALIPGYAYGEQRFFASDDAPTEVAVRRKAGFEALAGLYAQRYPLSAQTTAEARSGISDLQFTGSYRVPFQYSPYLRQHLRMGSFVQSSAGV